MMVLRKAWAFVWKDFLVDTSYRLSFVMQCAGVVFAALTLYFLSRGLAPGDTGFLRPYGGSYFAYALIGVALAGYLHASLQSFASCIREGQTLGTLEAQLVTQTGPRTLIMLSSIYSFVATSGRVVAYLLLGALLGMNLGHANYGAALLVLALTVIAFSSVGLLSASFVMVLKRGDPFNWIFSSASWLLGGVLYPTAVLPGWARDIASLLPITHSLEAMRLALLRGYSTSQLLPSLIPLLLFACILTPISLIVFTYAVRWAKRNGSLTHY